MNNNVKSNKKIKTVVIEEGNSGNSSGSLTQKGDHNVPSVGHNQDGSTEEETIVSNVSTEGLGNSTPEKSNNDAYNHQDQTVVVPTGGDISVEEAVQMFTDSNKSTKVVDDKDEAIQKTTEQRGDQSSSSSTSKDIQEFLQSFYSKEDKKEKQSDGGANETNSKDGTSSSEEDKGQEGFGTSQDDIHRALGERRKYDIPYVSTEGLGNSTPEKSNNDAYNHQDQTVVVSTGGDISVEEAVQMFTDSTKSTKVVDDKDEAIQETTEQRGDQSSSSSTSKDIQEFLQSFYSKEDKKEKQSDGGANETNSKDGTSSSEEDKGQEGFGTSQNDILRALGERRKYDIPYVSTEGLGNSTPEKLSNHQEQTVVESAGGEISGEKAVQMSEKKATNSSKPYFSRSEKSSPGDGKPDGGANGTNSKDGTSSPEEDKGQEGFWTSQNDILRALGERRNDNMPYVPIREPQEPRRKSRTSPKKATRSKPFIAKKGKNPVVYYKACKNLIPFAMGGAVVGIGAAIVFNGATLGAGLSWARLAYSGVKIATKLAYTHSDSFETFVNQKVKPKIETIDSNLETNPIYQKIKAFNIFLKKPETQWFLNGVAIGYNFGKVLNSKFALHDKLQNKIQDLKLQDKIQDWWENGANNAQTSLTETAGSESDTFNNQSDKIISDTSKDNGAFNVKDTTTNQTTTTSVNDVVPDNTDMITDASIKDSKIVPSEYSWLDINKKVKGLDKLEYGYVTSRDAISGNNSVHLLSKLASEDNGGYISRVLLENGKYFDGNIGELLDSGVNPSKVSVLIGNDNGFNMAWQPLDKVLEVVQEAQNNISRKV